MNAHDGNNVALYIISAMGLWIADNWDTVAFVAFGAVHACIAFDNWRYKRSLRNGKEQDDRG